MKSSVADNCADGVDTGLAHLEFLNAQRIQDLPVELLPIGSLSGAESPRVEGENIGHARLLADLEADLPPIVVHRRTMRVIDGTHRVRAALMRGQEYIRARLFNGSEEDSFLLSVAVNMKHGLPLSPADRVAAAKRIFLSRPQWSDRAVSMFAGISAKKASAVRRQLLGAEPEEASRVGRDGRSRPLNIARGRERASELIKNDPTASVRTIAKLAGISPATALDVRDRMLKGLSPIPSKGGDKHLEKEDQGGMLSRHQVLNDRRKMGEMLELFGKLRRDPSLRFSEAGRHLLRALDACVVVTREKDKILDSIPAHCAGLLAELLHGYAEIWRSLGEELERDKSHP